MYVNFDLNGKELMGYLHVEKYRKDIAFFSDHGEGWSKDIDLDVDADGNLFFMYDAQKVYLHDMKKICMSDLCHRIKKNTEHVTTEDFLVAMLCDGPWNTRFSVELPVPESIIPFMGICMVGDKTKKVPCKLKDSYNSEPHNGYKLEFEPALDGLSEQERESLPYLCTKRTYTSDIFSMIKSGIIDILDSVEDGKTQEEHIDEYFRNYI